MKENEIDTSRELKKLGRRIAELRDAEGLSQRKFALMIGMDNSYLSAIEAGERNPKFSTLARIAYALNKTVQDLFVY
ncbi:helix-turn-helix domain-containing protein [Raoultibacter massiliensis]|uniref:helix-turn-helix domain-containing protein n=1 Tax=Raoultibacter massiliensis TaxID=1852371 RepID=UPI003A95BB48